MQFVSLRNYVSNAMVLSPSRAVHGTRGGIIEAMETQHVCTVARSRNESWACAAVRAYSHRSRGATDESRAVSGWIARQVTSAPRCGARVLPVHAASLLVRAVFPFFPFFLFHLHRARVLHNDNRTGCQSAVHSTVTYLPAARARHVPTNAAKSPEEQVRPVRSLSTLPTPATHQHCSTQR